ncbi:MAG: hypothetical protein CMJ83_05590 [Planctomycetes bacterium]|nr:hypothetical protein [Planctomycetota bacterium]
MSRLTACFLFITVAAMAQVTTPTALFGSPGTQTNAASAELNLNGSFRSPGEVAGPFVTITAPGSISSTVCYQSFGSTTFPTPGQWTLGGQVNGAPNQPFALAIGVQLGATFCGGFAGWPCMTGPLLLGSAATPAGQFHLGGNWVMILDGIAGTAPPGVLNGVGTFPLAGSGTIDTVTNGGVEVNFAVQALVADPTTAVGLRFTAAATISQWVFYL